MVLVDGLCVFFHLTKIVGHWAQGQVAQPRWGRSTPPVGLMVSIFFHFVPKIKYVIKLGGTLLLKIK